MNYLKKFSEVRFSLLERGNGSIVVVGGDGADEALRGVDVVQPKPTAATLSHEDDFKKIKKWEVYFKRSTQTWVHIPGKRYLHLFKGNFEVIRIFEDSPL